jgi:radical SAM protein with 4Fe4S-binding SPASM domain
MIIDKSRFIFRELDGLLFDKENYIYHELNQTATDIISHIFTYGFDDGCIQLTQLYDEDRQTIEKDAIDLWNNITEKKYSQQCKSHGGLLESLFNIRFKFPLALELEVTKACNCDCSFCYNTWKGENNYVHNITPSPHMPIGVLTKILEEAANSNCFRIRISGGESMLHPQWQKIAEILSNTNTHNAIFTNGIYIPDRIKTLKRAYNEILISLHGNELTHNHLVKNNDGYKTSLEAIKVSLDHIPSVIVETLLHPDVVPTLEHLAGVLNQSGIIEWRLMPYIPTNQHSTKFIGVNMFSVVQKIQSIKERIPNLNIRVPCSPRHCLSEAPEILTGESYVALDNHCGAGVAWMAVSYDGSFKFCPHSNTSFGRVEETSITEAWDTMRPVVIDALMPSGVCGACKEFSLCRKGCHLVLVDNAKPILK